MHDIVFYKKRLGSISNIVVWHNSYGSTNSDLNIKKGWIVSIDVKYLNEDDNKVHLWIGESIRPTALEKLDMQFLRRPCNEPFTPPAKTSFYYFPRPEIEYGEYQPIAIRKNDIVKFRGYSLFTVVSVSGYEEDEIIVENDMRDEYYAKISDVIFKGYS